MDYPSISYCGIVLIRVIVIFIIDDKRCLNLHQQHCKSISIAIIVIIAFISHGSNDTKLYQSLISELSTIHQRRISHHSGSYQPPITDPSTRHQEPLNETGSTSNFRIVWFIVNLSVVCCFSDVYVNIIDCSPHDMDIILFKLIKMLSEITLLIARQSQCWRLEICNVIDIKFLIITNPNLTIGLVSSYSSVNDCFLTT